MVVAHRLSDSGEWHTIYAQFATPFYVSQIKGYDRWVCTCEVAAVASAPLAVPCVSIQGGIVLSEEHEWAVASSL